MAAANTDKFIKVASNTGWQLDASGISDASVTSFGLVSATSLPTDTAVILTIDRVNSSGVATPNLMERIVGVMSGTTVTSCVRGLEGTAQAHAAGAVVEIVISKSNINKLMEGILVEHNQDGTHGAVTATSLTTAGAITATEIATPSTPASGKNKLYFKSDAKLYKLDDAGSESEVGASFANLNAPQGFLINGKIVPSVAANNLTVAIKTLAGTDPSSTDPVYVRIGDTVRTISAALSVTKNAGTNWCNAGSSELATKEIDYFVYLGYNATDGVTIGFSRYPGANSYDDFSATTTNEKYCAISTITTAAATDYYEVIGRFAATLSAGAGYTWSVPTYTAKNLIQRPIYETRELFFLPRFTTGVTSPVYATQNGYYKISGNSILTAYYVGLTSGSGAGGDVHVQLPFTAKSISTLGEGWSGAGKYLDSGVAHYIQMHNVDAGNNFATMWQYNGGGKMQGTSLSASDNIMGTVQYII